MSTKQRDQNRAVGLSYHYFFELYLILHGLFVFAIFFPGVPDPDTISSLESAATGQFSSWRSPVFDYLFTSAKFFNWSPAPVLALNISLFFLAYYIFTSIFLGRSLWRYFLCTFLTFIPPILFALGALNRDSSMAFSMLLGTMLLIKTSVTKTRIKKWTSLLAGGFLLFYASCARVDALPILFPLLVCFYFLEFEKSKALIKLANTLLNSGLLTLLSLVFFYGAQLFLNFELLSARRVNPLTPIMVHDLATISFLSKENHFSDWPDLRQSPINDLEQSYVSCHKAFMGESKLIVENFKPAGGWHPKLRETWLKTIAKYPFLYLEHRKMMFFCLLGLYDSKHSPVMDHPKYFRLAPDMPKVDSVFYEIANPDNFLYRPHKMMTTYAQKINSLQAPSIVGGWFYVLLLLVSLLASVVTYCRDDSSESLWAAAISLSGLLHLVIFFFFAPAYLYYRYLTWTIFSAIFSTLIIISIYTKQKKANTQ